MSNVHIISSLNVPCINTSQNECTAMLFGCHTCVNVLPTRLETIRKEKFANDIRSNQREIKIIHLTDMMKHYNYY